METQNELITEVQKSTVEPTTASMLIESFNPLFQQAKIWKEKAEQLIVTDENQIDKMNDARDARLALKKIRVEADHLRKKLKEDSLRYGKAVQGVYNVIEFLISPIEKHLEEQERFVEIKASREKQMRTEQRIEILNSLGFANSNAVADMDDESFNIYLLGIKKRAADALAEAKQRLNEEAEQKKKEDFEREKIRIENEILKAQAKEKEKLANDERKKQAEILATEKARAKIEQDKQDKLMQEQRKEAAEAKANQDALLEKERAEKWKLQEQIRVQKEKEKTEAERIEREAEVALNMGDKEKFELWLSQISDAEIIPVFKSKKYNVLHFEVLNLIEKITELGK